MTHPRHRLASYSRYQANRLDAAGTSRPGANLSPSPAPVPLRPSPVPEQPAGASPRQVFPEPARQTPSVRGSQTPSPRDSGSRSRRQWSPERSRTLRRYRFVVLSLGILTAWFGATAFALWRQGDHLERQLAVAHANMRAALHILGELGIERPADAMIYRTERPIQLNEGPLQQVMFVPAVRGGSVDARLTLFNGSAMDLRPDVRVVLLDRLGLKLGEGRLRGDGAGDALRAGEMRAYHLRILLQRAVEPAWFTTALVTD